jgi:hypothetical protein
VQRVLWGCAGYADLLTGGVVARGVPGAEIGITGRWI